MDMYDQYHFTQPAAPIVTACQQWAAFLGTMLLSTILFYYFETRPMFRPVAVKQYPQEGVVHYGFYDAAVEDDDNDEKAEDDECKKK